MILHLKFCKQKMSQSLSVGSVGETHEEELGSMTNRESREDAVIQKFNQK